MKIEWVDEGWIEFLLWCPSQLYRRVLVDGELYTLYLRWRWEDPWTFSIIKGDARPGKTLVIDFRKGTAEELVDIKEDGEFITKPVEFEFITDDLFAENGLYFRDKEYKEAEKKAEELFLEWIRQGKNK